jgi:propionyl-CoA synthetase
MRSRYDEAYTRSLRDPEGFWAGVAEDVYWERRWDRVLDDARPPYYRWFAGGVLNTCYNALDLHIDRGRGKQRALVYDSPVTDTIKTFTFFELRDEVARLAGALRRQGIDKGDRVIIYMPMVPEAVIAMLACARIGAVHSVVFGGFASNELAKRIDDARPRLILSASCGIEVNRVIPYKPLLDGAVDMAAHKVERCVILQRPQGPAALVKGRDLDWNDFVSGAAPAECVPLAATDPLYVLYTSGTTGIPKGVVRDNGGHAVALKYSMSAVYGMGAGECFWAASDIGWVVGHSYIVYAPLLAGCTTILYEGKPVGTPDPGAFWRVIAQHGVNAMFTAPTAFRAIKKEDPKGVHMTRHDLSRFRTLFLAGERCDPDTLLWAREHLHVPVIDHWWQTETGWAIAANCVGLGMLPVKPGSPTKAVAGYDVRVLLREVLPRQAPRLLSHRRRRLSRRGRLPLHHESRGRHHQRRRPPALDRGDGGSAVRAPGHRRVRGGGCRRRDQGRGAPRLRRHQGRCQPLGRRYRQGADRPHPSADRAGGRVQDGAGGEATAQDALGQDLTRNDEAHRGQSGIHGARHDRRSGHPGRDHGRAQGRGVRER